MEVEQSLLTQAGALSMAVYGLLAWETSTALPVRVRRELPKDWVPT